MQRPSTMKAQGAGGGVCPADAPPDSAARLGYNGQLHEPVGCWQILGNGYRVYNPVLMRFHSPDNRSPFDEGGINAYAYCSCDPVNHTDSTGHFLVPLAAFMGIGAVGVGAAAGVMAAQGKTKEAGILGAIAGVLGAASMIVGSVAHSRGTASYLPQGEMLTKQGRHTVKVIVHGDRAGTKVGNRLLNGVQASGELRRRGVDGSKPIKLLSCHSADGDSPQAQLISNEFQVPVKGFHGKVSANRKTFKAVGPRTSAMFYPQKGAEREVTEIRNTALHRQRWGRAGNGHGR
ncbi:RHS repeat-associated core domain-containing protein [Stenotrophomonas sp. PD6]|uniref:RHS repeat-associated core domain-containing protein n=1 Tax=Stenotrophomonas sp. PD6 TaxID=3368612 RepID=UPI003BA13F0C